MASPSGSKVGGTNIDSVEPYSGASARFSLTYKPTTNTKTDASIKYYKFFKFVKANRRV